MKDAVLTIRVPLATRRRLQALARREGRSLSAQAERLIAQGLDPQAVAAARRGIQPLAGALHGRAAPGLADFQAARRALSAALRRRVRGRAEPRR